MKRGTLVVLLLIGASIISAITTVLVSSYINIYINNENDTTLYKKGENGELIRKSLNTKALETDFTIAAESTVNSVVSVKSFTAQRSRGSQGGGYVNPFDFFFGPRGNQGGSNKQTPQSNEMQPLGLGSGVIISADGYIVTNNHVIADADALEVTLNDNRTFKAQVIGKDATSDLALIKIDCEGLMAITFGNSESVKVGEWVLAVGNPFGFTSTVTAGIVSAKARSISSAIQGGSRIGLETFIQTDAAVNQGNSGGALVNSNGELVGINTAIYSQTGNYTGYSFAIPSSIVEKVITDIKEYGAVQRAILGVSFVELTSELAKEKGITAINSGIYVAKVEENSAATEVGLKIGDIITKINGAKVNNTGDMMGEMSKYRPGDKIQVSYWRDNKNNVVSVTLRNSQGNTNITKANGMDNSLGCLLKPISSSKAKELRISYGVEVSDLSDGKFLDAGIKNGFVITEINNNRIYNVDNIQDIYNNVVNNNSDKVMFISGYYNYGRKAYYAVNLSD